MGKVMFGLSMSLDGFIADRDDDVTEVFAWMGRAMEHFHEVVGDQLDEGGVVIMGHRSFHQIDNEIHLSIAHVLLGESVRLFDHLGTRRIHLEHIRTLETPGATHLSFRVVK